MAINEAVNIEVDVQGTTTVQQAASAYEDLGDAVSKTQLEAERLAQQYGITDKRTQEAIKVAGRYKREMEELDMAIDSSRGGTQGLVRATQGVAAGFEVAAGATALFGTESEELEKVLVQVQGAMVFSQGIADLNEFGGDVIKLAGTIRGKVVTAFKALKTAIGGLGIGILVVAIGTLIANWERFTNALTTSFPTLKKAGEFIGNLVQKVTDFVGITSEQDRMQQKVNDSIQENIDKTEEQIKIAEAQGNQQLALTLKQQKAAAEFALAKRKFQQEETEENKKALRQARLNFRLTNIAYEKYLAEQKKIREKANSEAAKQRAEDEAQRQKDIRLQNERENDLQGAILKTTETKLQSDKVVFDSASFLAKNQKQYTEQQIKNADAEALAKEELYHLSQDLGNAVVSLLGEQTAAGKAVALAQVAADTARALSGALANANSATPDNVASGGLAGIAKYITLATTIATNAKRAIDIIKSENVNQNAASGSASFAGGSFATNLSAPAVRLPRTEEFTGDRRVYVTEYDISNTQERVKVTEDVSIVK